MNVKKKTILLAAGGTGGHLFPAQALAENLASTHSIFFAGGGLAKNLFFQRGLYPFCEITAPKVSFSLAMLKKIPQLFKGVREGIKLLRTLSPELVVGFGSYYTFPLLIAALICRVPIILHEQNALPGKLNRLFSRYARYTACTFPISMEKLQGKREMAAYPLRSHFQLQATQEEARRALGLAPDLLTLCVFGGSQGAAAINHHFLAALPSLKERLPSFQVVHLTGNEAEAAKSRASFEALRLPHFVKTFEEKMHLVWQAADLVISRAGAGSVAEQLATATPTLFVPYPHASENHQWENANFVQEMGGGVILPEKELTSESLAQKIIDMYRIPLEIFRENIRKYREQVQYISFIDLIRQEF